MKYKKLIDKIIPFVVVILLLLSCSSTQDKKSDLKCENHLSNGFNGISTVKTTEVINKDTITYHQVNYLCPCSPLYLKKAMYDEYGLWDKLIRKKDNQVIAIWKDIDLISDGNLYTIFAGGKRPKNEKCYNSVMVLDEKSIDQLNPTSAVKNKLVLHFGNMIKNNSENRDFYDLYCKIINPKCSR